jgi:hypothetical protein
MSPSDMKASIRTSTQPPQASSEPGHRARAPEPRKPTKYYADSPTKGEGTAYALTVDGWYCLTDSGAQGSGAVGCEKDGLAFHTQA